MAIKETRKQRREKKTLEAMIKLYCRGNHKSEQNLCPECQNLLDYANNRIAKCPLGIQKTTCAQCPIHCYKADYRDRIKKVMRYSGPKMVYKHPVLAVHHLLDSKTKSKE